MVRLIQAKVVAHKERKRERERELKCIKGDIEVEALCIPTGGPTGTLQGFGRLTLQARHWIHDPPRFAVIAK